MGLLLTTHRLPERGNAPRVHNVAKGDKRGVDFESFLKELVSKRLFFKFLFLSKGYKRSKSKPEKQGFCFKIRGWVCINFKSRRFLFLSTLNRQTRVVSQAKQKDDAGMRQLSCGTAWCLYMRAMVDPNNSSFTDPTYKFAVKSAGR